MYKNLPVNHLKKSNDFAEEVARLYLQKKPSACAAMITASAESLIIAAATGLMGPEYPFFRFESAQYPFKLKTGEPVPFNVMEALIALDELKNPNAEIDMDVCLEGMEALAALKSYVLKVFFADFKHINFDGQGSAYLFEKIIRTNNRYTNPHFFDEDETKTSES